MKKVISVVLAVMVAALLFTSCSAQKKLVGTWTSENEVLGLSTKTEYTFNEDGTGTLSGSLGLGVKFTYTVEKDQLTIVTDTILTKTTVYTFDIEKDVLSLSNENESLELVKNK